MKPVFADSFYYLALLSERDAAHARAVAFTRQAHSRMVTTDCVLTEVADAMADPPHRLLFLRLLEALRNDPSATVVPASRELFDQAVDLYAGRGDKSWSLTDCASFVVMEQQGITDALTGDRHFEQAGFTAVFT